MAKISIIIPCYNVEVYIDRCLGSVMEQSIGIKNVEIICVDDASTDKTLEKLLIWEHQYPESITIVRSETNGRQGAARNIGMEYASGEWVAFIDSDDWITPDYYEKLIKRGEETGADVVGCGFTVVEKQTFEVGPIYHDIAEDVPGIMTHEKRCKLLKKAGSMVMKVNRASLINY